MKQTLSEAERAQLDRSISAAEHHSGAQIVVAVIGRSDNYPEIPWLAFVLGVSLASLAVFGLSGRSNALLIAVATILAAGGTSALLTIVLPGFARIFLTAQRAEAEIRQYAQALFLERELFATRRRRTVLLLVSLFEQQAVLLTDKGLRDVLSGESERTISDGIQRTLSSGQLVTALETALQQLAAVLEASATIAVDTDGADELANQVIEERGV